MRVQTGLVIQCVAPSYYRDCRECEERACGAMCALDSPLSTSGRRQQVYLTRRATSVGQFTSSHCSRNTYPLRLGRDMIRITAGVTICRDAGLGTVMSPVWLRAGSDARTAPLLYQCAVARVRAEGERRREGGRDRDEGGLAAASSSRPLGRRRGYRVWL